MAKEVYVPTGQGDLGLRSGLRDFADLIDSSAVARRVLVELRPGRLVSGFSLDSGSTYVAPLELLLDGVYRDVVAVETTAEPRLGRAASQALCQALPGTWFYDPDEPASARRWDDGAPWWDVAAERWDLAKKLYVHLPDDSDPNATAVSAQFGLYVAAAGEVHPALAGVRNANPDFEAWVTPSDALDWNEVGGAGLTIAREDQVVRAGAYALRLEVGASAVDPRVGVYQPVSEIFAGSIYRISGAYRTEPGNSLSLYLRFGVTAAQQYALSNGRDFETTAGSPPGIALAPTEGEWRRFAFDVRAWVSGTYQLLVWLYGTGSGHHATAYVDALRLQRVVRYNFYEPRLGARALPALEVGGNDVFFGGKRVGSGTLELLNADGGLDPALGALDWLNKDVRVLVGGGGPEDGAAGIDDFRRAFTGLVQGLEAGDRGVTLELHDTRAFVHRLLPADVYNAFELPGLDRRFDGQARRFLLGRKQNLTPVRLELGPLGYGRYEVAYCGRAPNGIAGVDAVWAYLDETAAQGELAQSRVALVAGEDYSVSLADGSVSLLRDPGPYEVRAAESDLLDFNVGGSVLEAALTPGLYTAAGLAQQVAARLSAAAGEAIDCAYDDATHKFGISREAGALQLLLSSGTNRARAAWKTLGFTAAADLSGSNSYTGDQATFQDAQAEIVLRVDAQGYRDDSLGTYTGTPLARIEKGPDLVKFLWRRHLGYDLGLIDTASFEAARSSAPEALGLYLAQQVSSKEIFDRVEHSCLADIVIGGDGALFFLPYDSSVPASAPRLFERDYLSFAASQSVADVYAAVQVQYDQDPSTGAWRVRTSRADEVQVRHGRPDTRAFETYLTQGEDAQVRANQLGRLAAAAVRKLRIAAKSGLFERKVGDKLRLSRARAALVPGGVLDGAPFRIQQLRSDYLGGRVEATLIEDVAL